MRDRRIPGAAVAVIDRGRVVLAKAYGFANLETETPLDTNAVFELASVTKQFTAAAIMLLVQDGKVRLDTTIAAYIDSTPGAWAPVTVRELLTHTGGIGTNGIVQVGGSPLLRMTTSQVFDFVAHQPLTFPPGEGAFYSDPGYFLLGMIIEKASGQSYRQFMQTRIFDPLHMTSSSILDRTRIVKHRVSTYELRQGELVNWRRDWDYELPAFFGVWSTLADLVRWDAALRDSTLLPGAALRQMWTPAMQTNGQPARVFDRLYGFGWELGDLRGHRTVGHSGASGAYVLRFVDEPLTVIVLTNLLAGNGRPLALAQSIAGVVRPDRRPPHLLPPQPDPDTAVTSRVRALLADMAARHDSPVMSDRYRTWYTSMPMGWQSFMGRQLGALGPLEYLGTDALGGRSIWGTEPVERLVYYAARSGPGRAYVTIGVNKDGKIGRMDYVPR
jgi:CubicO group peptidase (beta-lactamase class C family)